MTKSNEMGAMSRLAPSAPDRLAHLVFKTPRMDRMVDWYSTVLDAVVVFRNHRLAFLTYDDEHHRVALVRVPRVVGAVCRARRKVIGFDHAAFSYRRLSDLVANYRRLAE